MVSDINIKKADPDRVSTPNTVSPTRNERRRFTPRRFVLVSRLSRLILAANLIGLSILVVGSLAMSRFEDGLIQGKVDNLNSLAATITTVLGERATGDGQASQLDVANAQQVLRGVTVPEGWRVRLHDRSGRVVVDTTQLDDRIEVGTLDPIVPPDAQPEAEPAPLRETVGNWLSGQLHSLPWREARRDSQRLDLRTDVVAALMGDAVSGARYDADDTLVVMAVQPVIRVQQVLGAISVESRDVSSIVDAERRALAPIIGLALLVALASSLLLILNITLPMRKLARAAERVARNPHEYDRIPDLSRRRDEIGDLSLVLRDMTRGLYNRVDDIANFAADVAHEIKNPLTSLRSASETLRVAHREEDREKLLDIIQQDVTRMNRLITDISNASKVDANLARDTAQTLDVSEVIRNIVEFYDQTRTRPGPSVRLGDPLEETVYIRAFETPFAQVLRNLIDNALTFSSEDGVVEVEAQSTDTRVTLTVTDYGPGIPPDNLDAVFDRFYTERPEGAKFGSHSGLGLAICRQIVTAHKGRIWAENWRAKDGTVGGARFSVDLPRQTRGGGPSSRHRKRD